MPEKPRLHDSVQVYLGGSIATRSYTWQKPTFATELVGYRYPVHMSVALRKARIRHKYIRTILDKIVQKHNATIRKENYEATFAGQKAAYFQLKNGSQLEDHYIVYFDGQMIHAAVVYVGRVAKNDRRLKMGQAFFRSVKLIKVPRR